MGSLDEIIDYLRFGRTQIFEAISDLSERELTEIEIYEGWTIRDLLVHLIGWDEWVLRTIPLIVQDRADEIPPSVDPDEFNRQTLAAWQDKLFPEVILALQTTQQQVIELVSSLDYKQIDTRRERGGRIITIRSYVIELFVEHERKHVSDIQNWKASLNSVLDPVEVQAKLAHHRAALRKVLADLSQTAFLEKGAIGAWSVKDVIGHLADWESLMLQAAQHIYDPSAPALDALNVSGDVEEWNQIFAAQRENDSWKAVLLSLEDTQAAVDRFIAQLRGGDSAAMLARSTGLSVSLAGGSRLVG